MMNSRTQRRPFAAVAGLAVLVVACGCHSSSNFFEPDPVTPLPPFSPVVESTRPVSGVSAIRMDGVGEVFIQQGSAESLTLRTEELILPLLRAEMVGGELQLGFHGQVSIQRLNPVIEFHVTVTDLTRITLDGVSTMTATGIQATNFELVKGGVGNIVVSDLDATLLTVTQTGVGNVTVSGTVQQQDIDMGGVGDYNALSLTSQVADVTVQGVGSATVNVSDTLNAEILSGGDIFYEGSPVVNVSGNGSGHCTPI